MFYAFILPASKPMPLRIIWNAMMCVAPEIGTPNKGINASGKVTMFSIVGTFNKENVMPVPTARMKSVKPMTWNAQ